MIEIYTDGSLTHSPEGNVRGVVNRGGWCYVLVVTNGKGEVIKQIKRSGALNNTTCRRMEMTAIVNALHEVGDGAEVRVLSDDRRLVYEIMTKLNDWAKHNFNNGEMKNADLFEKIWVESKYKKIEWKGIRGHQKVSCANSINYYNDICDNEARRQAFRHDLVMYDYMCSKYYKDISSERLEVRVGENTYANA